MPLCDRNKENNMKISLICPQCASAAGGVGTWFVETIHDDGLYRGKCPNGHDLLLATQTLRHEMLFEIALNAIGDGYYREAVLSFASSVERYFEFAIRVISRGRGTDTGLFTKAWRGVAKQSERQFGAFLFLYLTEYRCEPKMLGQRMTELRNNVAHKGQIPERAEALLFGESAYEVIQSGIRQLRDTHLESVNAILCEETAVKAEKMGTKYPRSFQVTPTVLNVIEDTASGYKPFNQILKERGLCR